MHIRKDDLVEVITGESRQKGRARRVRPSPCLV